LGSTKEGLKHMAINTDGDEISCAALGDLKKNDFAFHLVNNGATRLVTIEGIPLTIKKLEVYVTDINRNMEQKESIKVEKGVATFVLDKVSFTSLMTK
jgi:hypothetical protein